LAGRVQWPSAVVVCHATATTQMRVHVDGDQKHSYLQLGQVLFEKAFTLIGQII
jgi:hypothetical protein